MNYYPLFRVRSWNNCMCCKSLYSFDVTTIRMISYQVNAWCIAVSGNYVSLVMIISDGGPATSRRPPSNRTASSRCVTWIINQPGIGRLAVTDRPVAGWSSAGWRQMVGRMPWIFVFPRYQSGGCTMSLMIGRTLAGARTATVGYLSNDPNTTTTTPQAQVCPLCEVKILIHCGLSPVIKVYFLARALSRVFGGIWTLLLMIKSNQNYINILE